MEDLKPKNFSKSTVEKLEESAPLEPHYPEERLCERCSVICFDDGKFGGFEATSKTGHPILKFDVDDDEERFKLDYDFKDILPHLPGLRYTAEAGCGFCGLLRDAILELKLHPMGYLKIELDYVWRSEQVNTPKSYGLNAIVAKILYYTEERSHFSTDHLIFRAEAGSGNCESWLRIQDATVQETLCEENILMMRRELDKCDRGCDHFEDTGFIPTLLLDLEAEHTDTSDGIRLVKSKTEPLNKPLQYAALSYCWGSAVDAATALKTDQSSMKSHLIDISLDSTPAVVRDAIAVARSLSIRYLWVDSLCIIQGDARDWERESKLMESVYGNAYVSICALASSSCHEGFLERPPPLEIEFRSSVNPYFHGTYRLRHHRQHQRNVLAKVSDPWLWDPISLDWKFQNWGNRAWTLVLRSYVHVVDVYLFHFCAHLLTALKQEEQLSHRILAFGSSRIYFGCPKRTVIESSLHAWHEIRSYAGFFQDSVRRTQHYRTVSEEHMYDLWLELIEEYASRKLTIRQDKLPAISGLAKCMDRYIDDIYLAGLWKRDLLRGLLWNLNRPKHQGLMDLLTRSCPTPYVSPTWSWASQDSSISTFRNSLDDLRSECEGISAWTAVEESSANPFGRIKDAALLVKGKMALLRSKLLLNYIPRSTGVQRKSDLGNEGVLYLDLDWISSDEEELLQRDISMLLLASTLDSKSESEGEDEDEDDHDDIMDSDDEGDMNPDEDNDAGPGEDNEATLDADPTNPDDISGTSTHGIADDDQNRCVWGILVHPARQDGKYIRVGRFRYPISGRGGMGVFNNCPFQSVLII